jgi:serine/threonine protein kinase
MQESWEWARARFLEEAQILAGFSHPAIVGVHRLIEANGTVYMVMDFIDGESYESRLRRIGREASQEALMEVIAPILDGLREVHSKNLLHRDIKPENILLSSTGQPMLIDFGSARTSIGATMSMTSIVTHGYSPIEQYQTKGRMGAWTDIYAIGAVMCRAITGEKPPVAADRIVQDDFEWVSNRKPAGYDETFLNAVDWALRVRVEDRPENISAFSQHIRLAPTPSTPPPLPTPPPVKVEPAPVVSTPTPKKEKNNNLKGFLILAIAISVPVFYFSGAFSKNESKATFDAANRSEYEDLRKNAEKELAELNIRIAEREKALQQPTATPTPQQPDAATYEKITALVAESDKAFRIGEYDIGLEKIRQADHLLPNDAGILLRIARLHEKRNETEDAASIYETVLALPDLGQELRTQTRRKLGMLEFGVQPGTILGIVDTKLIDGPNEKKNLRISIKFRPGQTIDSQQMRVHVYFYDKDPAGNIKLTESEITTKWISPPVDWKENKPEILDATYSPPSNHKLVLAGYVVGIYYKGALQDVRANPDSLATENPLPVYLSSPWK